MINLNQLRAYYQVAKCQNVSLAAKQLFVSHPAVTAQIKQFEESCGLKLFKKKGRSLILTDAGRTLFRHAKKVFESLNELKNEVVIIARTEDSPNIAYIPFSREELVLILPPNHPLANNNRIRFEQLAEEPIIMKDPGSGTCKLVDALFSIKGIAPKVLMETGDAEIIKLLAEEK